MANKQNRPQQQRPQPGGKQTQSGAKPRGDSGIDISRAPDIDELHNLEDKRSQNPNQRKK